MDKKLLEKRWRLILGKESEDGERVPLSASEKKMDKALSAVYGPGRKGGLKRSYPTVHTWLEDVRNHFPEGVVSMIQMDAIERLGLIELIAEQEVAEKIQPDIHLVTTILSLKGSLPEKVRSSARIIIDRIVREILKKLQPKMERSYMGYLTHRSTQKRPTNADLDWRKTIIRNLKHYDPESGRIIPERLYSYERSRKKQKYVVILVDSSASMSNSLVYSGIYACVLAKLPSLKTHLVLFDSDIADLSAQLDDPTDLIFGLELGGGTNISQALDYARNLISIPDQTSLFLITDLEEGYYPDRVIPAIEYHHNRGTKCICLTALSDTGRPEYDREMAAALAHLGIPVFGCSPDLFPQLLTDALTGKPPKISGGMFSGE
ncbi:MAG: VWA domain-containing protein [Saprospirales bacterium]|nr:MAG: VWA domain-containing protein [Saprospirales bacterium]